MIKHKAAKTVIAACLTLGGVLVGVAQSASADSFQAIDHLSSPNDYGYLQTNLDWDSGGNLLSFSGGYLYDIYNDGHGPYLHVYGDTASQNGGQTSACAIHNTSGIATRKSVSGCGVLLSGLDSVDIWVCNGGNAAGTGSTGCAGRKYYNQVRHPGKGSVSLGTHASTYSVIDA